ncbi:MAG: universal stress protein [Bacteroidetes bacterium]|jgi:nucleotide-binding universal stress UspA family protein|nr:universal stress protein [Bacteroidota bacterium]
MKPAIRTILVPTDFSDLSLEGIRYAMSLAELYGADLHLLHVVDDAPVLAFHTMEMTTDFVIEDTTRTAEQHLQAFAQAHDIHGREGVTLAVRHGNPYDEITRYAAEEQADMIVMATHGRTGLAHVLLGSVAEKVVQHADQPVLTVKPVRIRADRPSAFVGSITQ